MSGQPPPIGFVPSAPVERDAPPSYDDAMRSGPYIQQPATNVTPVTVKGAPYPAAQPYVVQPQVTQPGPPGFPHNGPPPRLTFPGMVPGVAVSVGPKSCRLECPQCHQHISTRVQTEFHPTAHLCAIALLIIGCFLCSCLPYCMSSFKNMHHYCPKCRTFIGTYRN